MSDPSTQTTCSPNRGNRFAWLALAALLVANLPLMLCMPLTADPVLYDLQAKTALTGGVLYRDVVEPNLPGIVWVHMGIRSLLGWSTYALRGVDLVIVGTIALLLALWPMRRSGDDQNEPTNNAHLPLTILFVLWCYFSMSEWTHCQRDIWLMLPAVSGLWLRRLQTLRVANTTRPAAHLFGWSLIEGVLWGAAFWIKPFVAIPATAAILVSTLLARQWRRSAIDLAGVLCGGAAIGLAGTAWLMQTGAWPWFWEMATEWNPTYFELGRERWTMSRYLSLTRRFYPWCLLHLVAVPVALRSLWQVAQTLKQPRGTVRQQTLAAGLLGAAYLGWLFQAHFLQHLFDYAHVPGTLLAIAVMANAWPARVEYAPLARVAATGFALLAIAITPATDPDRLAWWGTCLREGSTPRVRTALQRVPLPDWQELQPVIEFLEEQDLKDGELTAYNVFLIHLYPELGVRPSTRYAFLDVLTRIFSNRSDLIHEALSESNQRFVVSSLLENGMHPDDIEAAGEVISRSLPPAFPQEHLHEFPYNQPLVFRSGQYVVHRVDGPVGPLNTDFHPLERERIERRVAQLEK
ncbi:hypothetical protein Mal4_08070 [Maioricimonas rarisocia]|uniref:Glycosyltransferase RgtA/B/C/D-like domain-containing protein n=1 Tax=Maioricimonas rarisocia TaxID=2528026 RepID=A0A517Z225_9PLAN|nr:hypothetical protein [Maioricimonas rarisocia]QDU36521.1 hypothetical protein Mal4_08070 [Maioricimonas rarisocia]